MGLLTGYVHPDYAGSLAEFGNPRRLAKSGGWILERRIPGSTYRDAMGCYPLFACHDWSRLYVDLDDIGDRLVSLTVVTDPFGEYDPAYLRRCFKDVVVPFKEHFVVDLLCPMDHIMSKHHRYYSRKALRSVSVEKCRDATAYLDEWIGLYGTLIQRYSLTGVKAFSRTAFARQLSVPGTVMFRAVHQGETIGAHLWYVQGEVGYSHLEATSVVGYRLMAAYALYRFAIEWFAEKVRWLNLGAGATRIANRGSDGLAQFKKGWSTGTRPAYFCGRVFDEARYSEIAKAKCVSVTDYFPIYRKGEFG